MPKTAKAQNLHPKNVGFPNLPTCDKQQKLKTYIPTLAFQIFPHATNSKSSKPTSQRRWLSKSSNMPKTAWLSKSSHMRQTAKAQNLHPKDVGFPNPPTCQKQQKLRTYISKKLAFQIFQDAKKSKSSKPTSQKRWLSKSSHMRNTAKAQNLHPKDVGFPNLPTCEKQQKLKTYIPTLAFQIFPHAKNSKSSKPTSQRCLSKSSHMPKTAKAQHLHPKNFGFPNLPTCEKQQKLNAYIPKTLAFQVFPHAKNSKKLKTYIPKNVGFPNLPTCKKQQKLKTYMPRTLAFQIFPHAKDSKSSKPTSQKRWLSKSSHMRKTAKAQNLHPKDVGFSNLPTCDKQQKLKTYIPTLAFQILQHAKKQQKLKTYIPKTLAFQIFQHAKNSKSSTPTSQKLWLSKSSNMRKTAKAQHLHPKDVGFPNLPTCEKQQKLKTYIPKTLAFQVLQHAKSSKSSKPTFQKCWLSKSSHMPKTAKAQNLHPKNVGLPNLPTCET